MHGNLLFDDQISIGQIRKSFWCGWEAQRLAGVHLSEFIIPLFDEVRGGIKNPPCLQLFAIYIPVTIINVQMFPAFFSWCD